MNSMDNVTSDMDTVRLRSNRISLPSIKVSVTVHGVQREAAAEALIDSGAIHPEPSEALEILYRSYRPAPREQPTKEQEAEGKIIAARANPDVDLLLSKDSVPAVLQILNLKPSAEADLYRALEQARLRLTRGEVKKAE